MDQRDPVEKQNIPQEMARKDGSTRRFSPEFVTIYHVSNLGMMNVGVLLGVRFASTFPSHLEIAPLLLPQVGLDLDNSDYAFEHVGHNHVRFELKDQILGSWILF